VSLGGLTVVPAPRFYGAGARRPGSAAYLGLAGSFGEGVAGAPARSPPLQAPRGAATAWSKSAAPASGDSRFPPAPFLLGLLLALAQQLTPTSHAVFTRFPALLPEPLPVRAEPGLPAHGAVRSRWRAVNPIGPRPSSTGIGGLRSRGRGKHSSEQRLRGLGGFRRSNLAGNWRGVFEDRSPSRGGAPGPLDEWNEVDAIVFATRHRRRSQ